MTSAMKRALRKKGIPVPKPELHPAPPIVIKTRGTEQFDNGLWAVSVVLALAGANGGKS